MKSIQTRSSKSGLQYSHTYNKKTQQYQTYLLLDNGIVTSPSSARKRLTSLIQVEPSVNFLPCSKIFIKVILLLLFYEIYYFTKYVNHSKRHILKFYTSNYIKLAFNTPLTIKIWRHQKHFCLDNGISPHTISHSDVAHMLNF